MFHRGTLSNGTSSRGFIARMIVARTIVAMAFFLSTTHSVSAQSPQGQLRPVPRMGSESTTVAATPVAHDPQRDGWNLKWGRNPKAAEVIPPSDAVAKHFSTHDPFAETVSPATTPTKKFANAGVVQQATHLQPVESEPELRSVHDSSGSVSRAAWLTHPQDGGGFELPPQAPSNPNPQSTPRSQNDFFSNPFGDGAIRSPQPRTQDIPAPSGQEAAPASPMRELQAPPSDPVRPNELREMNQLRGELKNDIESVELPKPELPPSLKNTPASPFQNRAEARANDVPGEPKDSRSLRDLLNRDPNSRLKAEPDENVETLPRPKNPASPSDQSLELENPFGRRNDEKDPKNNNDRKQDSNEDGVGTFEDGEDEMNPSTGLSCEDFRKRIASQTIDKLSLDISPPFRPDVISEGEFQKLKTKFDDAQKDREWRSIDGRPLASGRLIDLAYEKVVIQSNFGTTEEISINKLSEADLAYISENWGLPKECLIEQVAYTPRSWQSTTMTWKASNLCHKPLYFEDVNLERYGHTRGPFWEPVVSSAHFFVNIAVLPYKMGVHTPGECQYALGYYRPGNCAPWIKPPVPISLRGGLTQATALTGAFWLIP